MAPQPLALCKEGLLLAGRAALCCCRRRRGKGVGYFPAPFPVFFLFKAVLLLSKKFLDRCEAEKGKKRGWGGGERDRERKGDGGEKKFSISLFLTPPLFSGSFLFLNPQSSSSSSSPIAQICSPGRKQRDRKEKKERQEEKEKRRKD